MAEKSLDQYRQEIQAYMDMEYTQAQMRRALQERYGIEVARSTLSDYIKTLSDDVGGRASPEGLTIQEAAKAAIMQAGGGEIIDRLAQVLEAPQKIKRESEEVHASWKQPPRHFEALYATFKG